MRCAFVRTILIYCSLAMVFNGHLYQLLNTTQRFSGAFGIAATQSYSGLTGHLVTITQMVEYMFARTAFPGSWLGVTDEVTEGTWAIVTGPERGLVAPHMQWANGEPNGGVPDDCAAITSAGLADVNCTTSLLKVAVELECSVPHSEADVSSCPCKYFNATMLFFCLFFYVFLLSLFSVSFFPFSFFPHTFCSAFRQ